MINQETLSAVSGWALRTENILKEQIDKRKVFKTGELKASLRHKTLVNGDQIEITFRFMLKGKFVDMGAGRGQKANTKRTRRDANKWYSPAFFSRLADLRGMIGYKMVNRVQQSLEEIKNV